MSQQPQREMTGIIFSNDKKKNDRAPTHTGTCTINGQELRIAAWLKEGRNGKFLSLQFSEPQQQQGGGSRRDNSDEPEFF